MSYAEAPEPTDAEKIIAALDQLHDDIVDLNERLDGQAKGLNSIGEQVNWLTTNTQGLFQMFSSPMFMEQIGGLMGGMTNGG